MEEVGTGQSVKTNGKLPNEVPDARKAVTTNAVSVKKLEVDMLEEFKRGYAKVLKGNLSALINPLGELVIPFGEYIYASNTIFVQQDAIGFRWFVDVNKKELGFFTRSGKLIKHPGIVGLLFDFNRKGRAIGYDNSGMTFILDSTGKKKRLKTFALAHSESFSEPDDYERLLPSRAKSAYNSALGFHERYGYLDFESDKYIVPPVYHDARLFSEGLAAVAVVDEFGMKKWGFIDNDGKKIIPPVYSIQPGPFRSGLALVTPAKTSAIDFAFINKQGTVAFNISTAKTGISTIKDFDNFYALAYGKGGARSFLVDTAGKILNTEELLFSFGETFPLPRNGGQYLITSYRDGLATILLPASQGGMAVVDMTNGKKLLINSNACRNGIGDHIFDPISKLRYACIEDKSASAETRKEVFTEGYINENNEFVIIRSAGSGW